jgi:hypothetical protein
LSVGEDWSSRKTGFTVILIERVTALYMESPTIGWGAGVDAAAPLPDAIGLPQP